MKKKILAIIPCRSGSKGIKNKNILNIFGKPLIYYSIIFAQKCKFIDKIIVSTDSQKYKKIVEQYGVKVPFLRPKKISIDTSLDIDIFKHTIKWLKNNENYIPDLIVHLRPTTPLRKIKILKRAINIMNKNKNLDSLRSISLNKSIPYKMWIFNKNNSLIKPVINEKKFIESFNAPRQMLRNTYTQNAVYDIFKAKLLKNNMINGKKIYGMITNDCIDIDTKDDLKKLNKYKKSFLNFKTFIKS
ncbi:cytidylyltransferase domain-containing protein [Candidatus Pelagibacter bacterium nBUS_30]|uniref:acylneuraminate cytidylyltransferase family protein n=1 Tax=Candidatus Pelagibacter bacterium nBUS_30 TaxID=3374191 RepID=UPI003EBFBEE2